MAGDMEPGVGEQDLGEMVLRVKERSSAETLGADGHPLAEHAHDQLPTMTMLETNNMQAP